MMPQITKIVSCVGHVPIFPCSYMCLCFFVQPDLCLETSHVSQVFKKHWISECERTNISLQDDLAEGPEECQCQKGTPCEKEKDDCTPSFEDGRSFFMFPLKEPVKKICGVFCCVSSCLFKKFNYFSVQCTKGGVCQNTEGRYTCACEKGYQVRTS